MNKYFDKYYSKRYNKEWWDKNFPQWADDHDVRWFAMYCTMNGWIAARRAIRNGDTIPQQINGDAKPKLPKR
jgi:hypothetical protein